MSRFRRKYRFHGRKAHLEMGAHVVDVRDLVLVDSLKSPWSCVL